nr:penicillin-binding transpeptidase domain-containing protein [Tumebacillus amylolyticus]
MEREKHSVTGKRMNLLFLVIFISLAVLIFRLSFLQLSQGQELLKTAESNRYITQSIPAPRGLIYDRNKEELVRNKPAFTITFQRLSDDVQNPLMLDATLYDLFGMRPEELWNAMDPYGEKYSLGMARKVVKNANDKQVAYVREHADELPGFNVVVEPIRDYVDHNTASHVIGYLNNIPMDFWKDHKDEYQQTDMIGTAGVEKQYEDLLHGKDGTLKVEVNINYQPLKDKRTEDPIKGHDLVLTIDKHIQEATDKALASTVQDLHKKISTVKEGAAVAMNPKTGEILAMSSYPSFDPTWWIDGMTDKKYLEDFAPAEKNRALTELYYPGSTVKMATELIGMKEGVIRDPNTSILDPGSITIGDRTITSWAPNLGYVNAYSALAKSSNVYMIKTFQQLSGWRPGMTWSQLDDYYQNVMPGVVNKIMDYHKTFGLGEQTTGLDLPFENAGELDRVGDINDWAAASFGQNEKYNLMQLANYVSTVANNGTRMQPYLVKQIIAADNSVQNIEPKEVNKIPFTQDQIKVVQRGMYDVTHASYGTFNLLADYKPAVAGKSGTSETGRGTENSLFVGYAPFDDPTFAIAIIIPDNEHNGHSGSTLGPIAKAMLDAYFGYDKKPDDKKQEKSTTSAN